MKPDVLSVATRTRAGLVLATACAASFLALHLAPLAGPTQAALETTRASLTASGAQANGESVGPALSLDGRCRVYGPWVEPAVRSDDRACDRVLEDHSNTQSSAGARHDDRSGLEVDSTHATAQRDPNTEWDGPALVAVDRSGSDDAAAS